MGSDITGAILSFIFGLLNKILPVFDLPQNFIQQLDTAFAFFLALVQSACYFIPLDLLGFCFTVMIAVDNFAIFSRIGQFIIKLIRG